MRRNFIRTMIASVAAAIALAGASQSAMAQAPKQIRFGLLPAEDRVVAAELLLDLLSGKPVSEIGVPHA